MSAPSTSATRAKRRRSSPRPPAPLVYVAHEPPAPKGEAILVPKDSPIKSVADLKGKKVALNKGSNVHYLLVKALEKAGVKYTEIEPVFLAPADARAAFERGAVDAWVIWDPFQAAAEVATGARTLADGTGLVPNHQFYLASQKFVDGDPQVVDAVIESSSARSMPGPRAIPGGGGAARPGDRYAGACAGGRAEAPDLRRQAAHRRVVAEQQRSPNVLPARADPETDQYFRRVTEARLMSMQAPSKANILWFLPTHGDGRYLGTSTAAAR